MMRFLLIIFLFILHTACNTKGPAILDYQNIKGYVLAREVCHLDPQKDDWLLDLSYMTDPPFGDTLTLDGRLYEKVVKVKGLAPRLQQQGLPVSIGYKIFSSSAVQPVSCDNRNAHTFSLRQITVFNQFEIR